MKLQLIDNPPNPFDSVHREWLGPPPEAKIEVYEETASSILSKNDSPDLPFTWSVNPYRGCQHACAYCYARPYHEYLGYGAGTDFDTKLIVKINAAELLRKAIKKKSWRFDPIWKLYRMKKRRCGVAKPRWRLISGHLNVKVTMN